MARESSERGRRVVRARAGARLLLAGVAVAICAVSLAFVSAATAKREHPRASGVPQAGAPAAPETTTSSSAPSQPSTPASQSGDASGATRPAAREHAHRHDDGGGRSKGEPAQSPGASSESATPARPKPSSEHSATGSAAQTSQAEPAREQGPGHKHEREREREHERGHHKDGSGGEPKHPREGGRHGKGHSREGGASGEEPGTATGSGSGSGTAGSGASSSAEGGTGPGASLTAPAIAAPQPLPAPAAVAPAAPAAIATNATLPGVPVTHAPVGRRHGARATHRARRTSTGRRGASAGVAERLASAPLALSSAAATAPTHARRAERSREDSRGVQAPATSPLVRTITKIVNVVPVALRWVIAALLALALALAARSWLAALRARRLEHQRTQLLADVGLLQAALLPAVPARLGPVGTSVAYQPATGPGAGGDFYDVFALEDGQIAVIVGDVSGHGRQALPYTALVRFTLRAYLEAGLSPRDALQTAGAVLDRQLGGAFATVVVATYQPRERLLVYACAGHPPPLVLGSNMRAGSLLPVTVCGAPPIGVGMRTGTRQSTISIPGRAQICFHTDGVTEARVDSQASVHARLFGAERLAEALADLGLGATAQELLARVAERAETRPDDMAACLLSIDGGSEQPMVLVDELELDRAQARGERTERFLLACGVPGEEIAEVTRSAYAAAGPASTVVLELRRTGAAPEIALRRDHLAYLHARRRRAEAEVGAR